MRTSAYIFGVIISFFVGYNIGVPNQSHDIEKKSDISKEKSTETEIEKKYNKLSSYDKEQVIWLARAIYSETKLRYEMVSIGWTIRNRVDTNYRGRNYKDVALYSHQFSGLMPSANHYEQNTTISWNDRNQYKSWKYALKIAIMIYQLPGYMRPFEKTVRHFYSPSVVDAPEWAIGHKAVRLIREDGAKTASLENVRFAFYNGID